MNHKDFEHPSWGRSVLSVRNVEDMRLTYIHCPSVADPVDADIKLIKSSDRYELVGAASKPFTAPALFTDPFEIQRQVNVWYPK